MSPSPSPVEAGRPDSTSRTASVPTPSGGRQPLGIREPNSSKNFHRPTPSRDQRLLGPQDLPGSRGARAVAPNMRFQRTRRPSLRSGRSRRSLGSPLTRYPLGAARKSCVGPRFLLFEMRLRPNGSSRPATSAAAQGANARPAAVAISGLAAHLSRVNRVLAPAPPSPSASPVPAQNRGCPGVTLERECCA